MILLIFGLTIGSNKGGIYMLHQYTFTGRSGLLAHSSSPKFYCVTISHNPHIYNTFFRLQGILGAVTMGLWSILQMKAYLEELSDGTSK